MTGETERRRPHTAVAIAAYTALALLVAAVAVAIYCALVFFNIEA